MRTTSQHSPSPLNPVRSFMAVANGDERVTLKEPVMFDLVATINQARKTYEAAVSVRAAIASGGDPDPLMADLAARFKDQATAMGFLVEKIEDDAAAAAVENRQAAE